MQNSNDREKNSTLQCGNLSTDIQMSVHQSKHKGGESGANSDLHLAGHLRVKLVREERPQR